MDSSRPRFPFDRSTKRAFQRLAISPDSDLLLHRELDEALGLIDMAAGWIEGLIDAANDGTSIR